MRLKKGAYTLTDRGTYLALQKRLTLDIVLEKAWPLQNIYHVMELNSARFRKASLVGGKAFADFMVSPAAQTVVQTFGVDQFGQPLFFPAVGKREENLAGGED